MVDVAYVETFASPVSLETIKKTAAFKDMVLVKLGRLSVQPVKKKEFDTIVRMGRKSAG